MESYTHFVNKLGQRLCPVVKAPGKVREYGVGDLSQSRRLIERPVGSLTLELSCERCLIRAAAQAAAIQ